MTPADLWELRLFLLFVAWLAGAAAALLADRRDFR